MSVRLQQSTSSSALPYWPLPERVKTLTVNCYPMSYVGAGMRGCVK